MVYLPSQKTNLRDLFGRGLVVMTVGILGTGGLWLLLFISGVITLGGVPYSVVIKGFLDAEARSAYFSGDAQHLHDRLDAMGIEWLMKNYYRDRIPAEMDLDQHIHQILYDRTGYVGADYRLGKDGQLMHKGGPDNLLEITPEPAPKNQKRNSSKK